MNNCIPCQKDFSEENIAKNGPPLSLPGEAVLYSGDYDIIFGITEGDNLNTIVAKIADYFKSQITTTTTSTSTSTSTSSTTTTTTTIPTTTTTTSTSSTTTSTTTAAPLDTIFYGFKDEYGDPNEAQILAGASLQANASGDITIPFNTLVSGKFYWFFIPTKANSQKNAWADVVLSVNNGGIGSESETFGPYAARTINGIQGFVSTGQFATEFANPIKLSYNL